MDGESKFQVEKVLRRVHCCAFFSAAVATGENLSFRPAGLWPSGVWHGLCVSKKVRYNTLADEVVVICFMF